MQADCFDGCLDATYWKTLFDGVTEPTHFSANKASTTPLEQRVADTDTFAHLLTHNLSPEWVAMLNAFCVDIDVDCSTLFSASWNWMLYQYSGESVVTSGVCDIPCKTVIPTVQSFPIVRQQWRHGCVPIKYNCRYQNRCYPMRV
jgi:hypothetical protein